MLHLHSPLMYDLSFPTSQLQVRYIVRLAINYIIRWLYWLLQI